MNRLYDAARQRYLEGARDWRAPTWDVYLLDGGYVFDAAHTLFSVDVPVAAIIALAAQPLLFLTTEAGVAGSTGAVFEPILAGRQAMSMVIVNRAADELEWFGDTGLGLPFMTINEEVVVSPDRTIGGFFSL